MVDAKHRQIEKLTEQMEEAKERMWECRPTDPEYRRHMRRLKELERTLTKLTGYPS